MLPGTCEGDMSKGHVCAALGDHARKRVTFGNDRSDVIEVGRAGAFLCCDATARLAECLSSQVKSGQVLLSACVRARLSGRGF